GGPRSRVRILVPRGWRADYQMDRGVPYGVIFKPPPEGIGRYVRAVLPFLPAPDGYAYLEIGIRKPTPEDGLPGARWRSLRSPHAMMALGGDPPIYPQMLEWERMSPDGRVVLRGRYVRSNREQMEATWEEVANGLH